MNDEPRFRTTAFVASLIALSVIAASIMAVAAGLCKLAALLFGD